MRRERKIPCPKCGQPLRHRALSNLRWCANPTCPDYKGIPPIEVNIKISQNLLYSMSDEAWEEVETHIKQEGKN